MPAEKLFGTDGIRGIAGRFPIDESGALKIGAAVARVFSKGRSPARIAVGADTRKSGVFLREKICEGLISRGAQVISTGVCPTPALAVFVLKNRLDAAIMVSASHNPPEYNGFKILNSEGFKISQAVESEIEKFFYNLKDYVAKPEGGCAKVKSAASDWLETYERALEKSVSAARRFSGMKIALDCANGAMSAVAPQIFEKTGAEISAIGTSPDGSNINKNCGSLCTAPLGEAVRRHGAMFGAALDGDGDRVAFCDENGNEIDGDLIIALFAREMFRSGALKKPLLATTVMSNQGLEIFLEGIGIKTARTDVGDRNVVDFMRKNAVNFGGEKSGHLIFSDCSTGGDGLLAALLLAGIIVKKNRPLSQILPKIRMFPQVLKNVQAAEKIPFASIGGLSKSCAQLKKQLGAGARICLRYSGTEPLARILVEGADQRAVSRAADEIAGIISRKIGRTGNRVLSEKNDGT